jgi:hypothetical protein
MADVLSESRCCVFALVGSGDRDLESVAAVVCFQCDFGVGLVAKEREHAHLEENMVCFAGDGTGKSEVVFEDHEFELDWQMAEGLQDVGSGDYCGVWHCCCRCCVFRVFKYTSNDEVMGKTRCRFIYRITDSLA